MKSACLVFMVVGFAALLQGTSFAALSGTASQQGSSASSTDTASDRPRTEHAAPGDVGKHKASEKPSDEERDRRRVSDNNHPRSQASLPKTNRPKQIPNRQEHSASGNAMNLHQPGSDKSRGVAQGGSIENETVKSARPAWPPSVVRPTTPSLNNMHHRGANPAVIGGLANAKTGNTGAINGTAMNRRP
jgi:hypothetical protein